MSCYSPNVCTNPVPAVYCPQPKPPNSLNSYPNRCNSSDFTKLKKDLTMNEYYKNKYPTTFHSYNFKMNLQWGTYVNSTICQDKCKCISLY